MKLLLVSPLPPPIGGIASWSTNILDYYAKNQSRWEIYHQNSAIKTRQIINKNLLKRVIGGITDSLRIIFDFKKNIQNKPELVHITSSASYALLKDYLLLRIAKNNRIPVVLHFHFGRIPELALKKNLEWKLLCCVIKISSRVVVLDKNSLNTLDREGFKNINCISNPISLDLEKKAKLQQLEKIRSIHNRVLFVGHVIHAKGVKELVKACSNLTSVEELIFIGPFEESIKNELISLAKVRGNIEWINFKGTLSKEDILHEISHSTLLALPSYTEGFPNVIIEAMAMGRPVVATAVGAIPEMLTDNEKKCGICIKVNDEFELTNAIKLLFNDCELANKMGKNGNRKVLKCYTLSAITKSYEIVWDLAYQNNNNSK